MDNDLLESPSPMAYLVRDPLAMGLLLTTLLLIAGLYIWLYGVFESLPDLLPLHFDAQGNADRIAERREIFVLPAIGVVIAVVNLLMGLVMRLRFGMIFASYLIWGGALLTEALIWIAVWNITH